jgi:hypothetical protein
MGYSFFILYFEGGDYMDDTRVKTKTIYEYSSDILRIFIEETGGFNMIREEIREESRERLEGLLDDVRLSKEDFFNSLANSGLTQTNLAKMAKVSKETVRNYGTKTSEHVEIYLSLVLSTYVLLCETEEHRLKNLKKV